MADSRVPHPPLLVGSTTYTDIWFQLSPLGSLERCCSLVGVKPLALRWDTALTLDVLNVKYLAFDTPKKSHMKCSICQNIWHGWIIQSQIWKYMDKNCKIFIVFLISFSLSSLITQISSSLLLKKRSLPLSFSLNLSSFLLLLLMLLLSSS